MSDKDSNFDNLKKAAISGSAYDNVQRYGSAVKEHIKVYTGIDTDRAPNLGLVERFNFGLLPRFNLSLVARFNFGLST